MAAKLYYSPGACSLADHIALHEAACRSRTSASIKGRGLLDAYSVADPFVFVMLCWAFAFGIGVPESFVGYFEHVKARPATVEAVAEEGID